MKGNELFASLFLLQKRHYRINGILQIWRFSLQLSMKGGPAWLCGELMEVQLLSFVRPVCFPPPISTWFSSSHPLLPGHLSVQSLPPEPSRGTPEACNSPTPGVPHRRHLFVCPCCWNDPVFPPCCSKTRTVRARGRGSWRLATSQNSGYRSVFSSGRKRPPVGRRLGFVHELLFISLLCHHS